MADDYELFCATYPGVTLDEFRQDLLAVGASPEKVEAEVQDLARRRQEAG